MDRLLKLLTPIMILGLIISLFIINSDEAEIEKDYMIKNNLVDTDHNGIVLHAGYNYEIILSSWNEDMHNEYTSITFEVIESRKLMNSESTSDWVIIRMYPSEYQLLSDQHCRIYDVEVE